MDQILKHVSTSQDTSDFKIQLLIDHIYKHMQHKSYHHRLHYKKYIEDNLIQLFSESSQEYTKWEIYNVCRSIIFDTTGKIVTYSHPNLQYLQYEDAIKYFDNNINLKLTESHEGTLIGVFYHNNKWYYGTRRHIDMYQTHKYVYGVKSELSHGQMFEEALGKLGMTKSEFESKLDNTLQYYIELVHYQNSFNITYEERFGENYAKLFLLFVRNEKQELCNISDFTNFPVPINPEVTLEEVKTKLNSKEKIEGFIFERIDTDGVKHLCKVLHPEYYTIIKYSPGFKTIQEQYIYLYQKDLLNEYVTTNNKVVFIKVDDNNIEVVGLVTNFFTHIGQRLLDIYYKFNNNNMVHRNEELFKKVFMEEKKYPFIFYTLGKMKGIHKNKQININEMRKFLKYQMIATDVWKLGNEITKFEIAEVGILQVLSNKLVKYFY